MALRRLLAERASGPGVVRIHSTRDGETHVIALDGEMCLESAPRVEQELLRVERTSPEVIILDLRGLQFIDSCGIRVMLHAHHRAPQAGCRLLIVRGPRSVQRPFELCGLAERLPFVEAAVTPRAS